MGSTNGHAEKKTTGAEGIHWDLTHMYPSVETLKEALASVEVLVNAFADQYRGGVASLDAASLASTLSEYEAIQDGLGKAYTYAFLNWSTATSDPERGALLQFVKETYARLSQEMMFFELEWIAVDEEQASPLIDSPELGEYRHYLSVTRLSKDYVLTEPEERIMSEKSVTGASAWTRFFDQLLSGAEFGFRDETISEQEILAKLREADRDVRCDAAVGLTNGLKTHLNQLAFVFNTILADKAANDRLRGYPNWVSARNMSNQVNDENVEALVGAVTGRYDLVERFYRLKSKLLGYDVMYDYDRYAPLSSSNTIFQWDRAKDLVISSYSDFHPEMGGIASRFFEEKWIDAAVADGKRGGAFSHGAVPSTHPYVLMNYTGNSRDVQTLAHELGHGVHQYLSRDRGVLQASTPLTTAETASVFGEMLVFQELLRQESDPANRLAMLVGKIDDTMATVFRQVTMNRFEDRIHTHRRNEGELSNENFAQHWMETQRAMYGESVSLTDDYAVWWSYIPHFLHTPGYVYAYAFGELLVLALYSTFEKAPDGFADKYVQMLAAGGSDWPHEIVGKLGIDLNDLGFWDQGLNHVDAMISDAEKLAEEVGG